MTVGMTVVSEVEMVRTEVPPQALAVELLVVVVTLTSVVDEVDVTVEPAPELLLLEVSALMVTEAVATEVEVEVVDETAVEDGTLMVIGWPAPLQMPSKTVMTFC